MTYLLDNPAKYPLTGVWVLLSVKTMETLASKNQSVKTPNMLRHTPGTNGQEKLKALRFKLDASLF